MNEEQWEDLKEFAECRQMSLSTKLPDGAVCLYSGPYFTGSFVTSSKDYETLYQRISGYPK